MQLASQKLGSGAGAIIFVAPGHITCRVWRLEAGFSDFLTLLAHFTVLLSTCFVPQHLAAHLYLAHLAYDTWHHGINLETEDYWLHILCSFFSFISMISSFLVSMCVFPNQFLCVLWLGCFICMLFITLHVPLLFTDIFGILYGGIVLTIHKRQAWSVSVHHLCHSSFFQPLSRRLVRRDIEVYTKTTIFIKVVRIQAYWAWPSKQSAFSCI